MFPNDSLILPKPKLRENSLERVSVNRLHHKDARSSRGGRLSRSRTIESLITRIKVPRLIRLLHAREQLGKSRRERARARSSEGDPARPERETCGCARAVQYSDLKFHSRRRHSSSSRSLTPLQGYPDEHNRRLSSRSEERRRRIVAPAVVTGRTWGSSQERSCRVLLAAPPHPLGRVKPQAGALRTGGTLGGQRATRGQYLCTLLTDTWIYARPLYYASCRPSCKAGMPGTHRLGQARNKCCCSLRVCSLCIYICTDVCV